MRNAIKEYIEFSSEEKNDLWNTATFVFDTNVFLNLYRYSNKTRNQLIESFECLKPRIWMPYQVALEFCKDRYNVIDEVNRRFEIIEAEADNLVDSWRKKLRLDENDQDVEKLIKYLKDWVIKKKVYSFMEAIEIITGQAAIQPPVSASVEQKTEKVLLLPKPYRYTEYVVSYLKNRGIDMELIDFCLKTGRLYESAEHHNAVFVGRDQENQPRYAALRGVETNFIGEASGSDKHYSFCIPTEGICSEVHLFESAIDLLSYATMEKLDGKNWRETHLLSLAGVYRPAQKLEESKIPSTLVRFLKEYPHVQTIVFHLDNDRAGRLATKAIQMVLPKNYQTKDKPPLIGKDYNDFLCSRLGLQRTIREKKSQEKGRER